MEEGFADIDGEGEHKEGAIKGAERIGYPSFYTFIITHNKFSQTAPQIR